jgi:Na+-translocating ferredoxin:NAD+ oxidoreductase RnfE subunit
MSHSDETLPVADVTERQRDKSTFYRAAWTNNAFFVQAAGFTMLVAAASTLRNAVVLSALSLLLLLANESLAALLYRRIPFAWLRRFAVFLVSALLLFPILFWLDWRDDLAISSLGIFLPLLTVDSVSFPRVQDILSRPNQTLRGALVDAAGTWVGYAGCLLLGGFVRELFGGGMLWGKPVADFSIRFLQMPLGGMFLLGLLAAGRNIVRSFIAYVKTRPADEGPARAPLVLDQKPVEIQTIVYELGKKDFRTGEFPKIMVEQIKPQPAPAAPDPRPQVRLTLPRPRLPRLTIEEINREIERWTEE